MKFISLASIFFLLASLISFSGAQADAHLGERNLNNSNNNNDDDDNWKCVAECTRDLKWKRGFNNNAMAVCARAKEVKLGMVPYYACLRGTDDAFTLVCAASCATTSDAKTALMKSSAEACKKWKGGMSERYTWCKRGFNGSWEKLSSVVSSIIEEKSVEVEESVKDLIDANQDREISQAEEVNDEKQLKSKVEESVDGSVKELADRRDISPAQVLVEEVDHSVGVEEPFKYEVEESVGGGEPVELEELAETIDTFQAQLAVKGVDHVVEEQVEILPEESGDKSVKHLAYSAKLFVQELEQIKVEFDSLGRNTDFGSASTCQVQELAVGLIYSHVHGTTQNKEISSGTEHSPDLHGITGAEAITHLEHFASKKACTGTGNCADFYTPGSEWSRRYIYNLGSESNHDTAIQLQTCTDKDIMGEADTNYAWNITSVYLPCIRTEVADHIWLPRNNFVANCDNDEGGQAIILAAQAGDVFQFMFIDTGPAAAGYASSSKSFTWEGTSVTRLGIVDLLLLEPSSDIPLQLMNELRDLWQHLYVRQQVEQTLTDITKHSQQRLERKIAFTSHDFIVAVAVEVILYVEPQLGFKLRERATPISTTIIPLDVLKQLCNNGIKNFYVYCSNVSWVQDDTFDHQIILNHQFSNGSGSCLGSCLLRYSQLTNEHGVARNLKALRRERGRSIPFGLHSSQIILLLCTQAQVLKEHDSYAPRTQVLYIATTLSTSKSVPMGDETANGQCQSDYRESYGLDEFVDPLAFESSHIAAQPLQLQTSLGRPSHAWLAMSRRMVLDCLSLRAPNIAARRMDLDEGDSESCHSGGFDRTYAPFSCYEVSRLHLNASMLDVSDAGSTIIASIYKTGWDDYHPKQDVPNIGHICLELAFILLVFHRYYCPGMRMRRTLESPIAVHLVILEAFEKRSIEWEFQRRQQAKCITPQPNLIGIKWMIASKMLVLANKGLHSKSKFELGRLHSESGPCWTQFGHHGRHRRNYQRVHRVRKALEKSPNKYRMMQRNPCPRLCSRFQLVVYVLMEASEYCPSSSERTGLSSHCLSFVSAWAKGRVVGFVRHLHYSLLTHLLPFLSYSFRVQASSLQQ